MTESADRRATWSFDVINGGLGHDDKDLAIRQYRLTRERIKPRLRVVQPMCVVVPYLTKERSM
jgi:hypothetical protein